MQIYAHHEALLYALASKFYNDSPPTEKPKPSDYVAALQRDLLNFTASVVDDPVWMVRLKVQQGVTQLGTRELTLERSKRMSGGELHFFAEEAMHLRYGHTICLPSETVKNVSAWRLDRNITGKDVADLKLPDYMWFEWPKFATENNPPWISRTIGMLISRFVLLDAPIDTLHKLTDSRLVGEDTTLELMRELLINQSNSIPCLGYRLTIVQQDESGYRFVPSMFGHEQTESLVGMLGLLKEVSDRDKRKFRQTEQVWSNVAMRLLLLAAHKGWSTFSVPASQVHTLYGEKTETGKKISIRPDYRTRFQPFSVINE